MPSFEYAVSTADEIRSAGVVQAETLADALVAVESSGPLQPGDELLIGIAGFPPAQFECAGARVINGNRMVTVWKPHTNQRPLAVPSRLAA